MFHRAAPAALPSAPPRFSSETQAATQVPRPSVAFVTQDAYLFHDTIRENIIFGLGDVSDRDLIDACKAMAIGAMRLLNSELT